MAGESLCIGDHICLYSEENFGYVYALQTSSVHSEVAVHQKQNREKPDVPDPSVITFEVCVANRYKLNKKLRKLEAKSSSHPENLGLKSQVAQAEISAEAENEDNETEQKRQRGKKVLYGQIIQRLFLLNKLPMMAIHSVSITSFNLTYNLDKQLRHVFTAKYLHVSTTQTSRTETSNMQVDLERYNSKHAQFKIMPRYKVKAEGDVVQQDDQVVLESVKSPGQYLRVSKVAYESSSIYQHSHELNLSVRQSGFTIYRRYKPEKEHESFVKAGVPIRLFHKEIEAYLVAEGLFDDITQEDVHLRVRGLDQNNPKTLYQSTSAITYWQVEMQDGALSGNVLKWEQQCRLRHLTTRLYLKVESKKVTLTKDHDDPNTVFRMHPVIKEKDEIEFETYCRFEHVVTATWLHAMQDEFKRQQFSNNTDDMSMANLQWTAAPLKKICVSEEMQYDDAFTLQEVEQEHVENFYYMAGMVPFIQKIIKDKKAGQTLNMKQAHEIVAALTELKTFMLVDGSPNKNRQKLLRNLRMVELLVDILKLPYRGSVDKQHMTKILVECYDVLYTYLMGDSRKNELYIAKHIEFFESQIATEVERFSKDGEGEIGLNAAHMVMELVKDNRKIVDRITHSHIDKFVELLNRNKNFRYLDLLSVLCVCDGVAIPDNQKYITEKWLMSGQKNCVYHTELGEAIGKEPSQVYVSKDSRRTWIPLTDFVSRFVNSQQNVEGRKDKKDEEFLFLDHQLDLFGKLCYGRNEFAINVITEQLGYLTWNEAFLSLSNNSLPDQLRAKYCSLITGLFVDVGENISVLDRITLTFIYDEIGAQGKTAEDMAEEEARDRSVTKKYFPQLRDWISQFLDNNKDMTASMIGHNLLVEQVLRLVHYLVKYGYYGDLEDIKQLLGPMLDLVDGRNDKPYPIDDGGEVKTVWEKYKKEGRYKPGQETAAIVNAKYQAMDVIDLFFNFRFNTRLERFIEEFKFTYNKAHHGTMEAAGSVELAPLLTEEYDIELSHSTNYAALKLLRHIFEESAYFKSYDLTDILMDLSQYEYDKMVVSSMSLMNRYYSAHDNLFRRAVQAQVLITDKSSEVLKLLHQVLPVMTRLKDAKMTDEQTVTMTEILDRLIAFCHLENEPEEEHPMNQSILYNHDILNVIFDILSQEIDVKLIAQYKGIKRIFEKSFMLLKGLARNNEMVQQRLFDRLDMLLTIQGAEQQMAECLTEVFTGNKQTCMKVLSYQVQKITALAAQHTNKAPQFLEVLDAIVKVEELNLPLKRNQGYVMKYFMQYRSDVAYVIDQPQDNRRALLKGGDSADLEYLMALVDLLATCAEGENRFIESICQTIFSVQELLDILNDDKIDNNLKRPFLRFLLWVYMNTASGMIESGAGDLPHDINMWKYLNDLSGELKTLAIYAKSNPETVKQLLKKPPKKSDKKDSPLIAGIMDCPDTLNSLLSEHGKGDWKLYHGSLHYILEAVLPFLQVFFKNYYQIDTENYKPEADQVDDLSRALVEFTGSVGNLISNPTYMKTMVSSMNVILSASTLPVSVMEEFQSQFGRGVNSQDIRSDARKTYDEYYEREEELNAQLNVFAVNYSVVYGGINDVKTQIGYNIDRDYTELGGDEELPLGEEFQSHIKQFVRTDKRKPKDKYKLCSKLVEQLAISGQMTRMSEKERLNQEVLDIKCLQLLRAIVHNNIVKLPDDWEGDTKGNRKILGMIEESQNFLNEHGGVLKVLDHLGRNSDNIVREVLAFTAAMLFGGNHGVQKSLEDYFLGTREEKFFFSIKNRMNLSAIATKEKRTLMAQHQAKIEDAIEQAKALQKAMLTGKMAESEIMQANQMGSMLMISRASFATPRGTKNRNQGLKARYAKHSGMGSRRSLNGSTMNMKGGAAGGLMLSPRGNGLVKPSTSKTDKGDLEMKGLMKQQGSRLFDRDNKVSPMQGPQIQIETMDEKQLEEMAFISSIDNSDDLDYHDDGYLQLVLRVLGLMTDGQNSTLQNYLREQPDNIKSVNLVAETSKFLALLYGSINKKTIALVTELFQALIEFVSGNPGNQGVVFDNKVCDYINHILRGASFQGCNQKEIMELKMSIATLINAMIEENPKVEESGKPQASHMKANVSRHKVTNTEVVEALDPESIWMVALDCYQRAMNSSDKEFRSFSASDEARPKNDAVKQVEEEREFVLLVGFKYFHVLMRMIDLVGERQIRKDKLWKAHEGSDIAWPYFERSTLSIEIVKDDVLQKVYFRCKDKSVLREDVKEKFKYEVDRSTPSNKLREFMDWSVDIIKDIKYTRSVFSNLLSRFFVKYWWHFNMAMIFISFVFFMLIMITWKEPTITDSSGATTPLLNSSIPDYNFNANNVIITTYVLGGFHNLFTLCVLISYFITNHPSLPKFRAIRRRFCKKSEDDEEEDDDDRESHLEEKIFSFNTAWYILLFGCSILGTIFYGYFFSVHLLHMANFNQLLKRAIQAVTKNGASLLWVFLFGIIFIWIFSLISFAFYRELYDNVQGIYCSTMYECFTTTLHRGLVLTLHEFLIVPDGKPYLYHLHKAVFDLSFFILITTIGLNIIFGIIVDTFSELRDNKWNVDNDMHSTCFICSRGSYDFEHQGGGFENHVKSEHNQWAYLFFFIHLDETRTNDYTALELFVYRLLQRENYDFFPINRALTLQHEEDSNEVKLETLMGQVTYLVKKMKEEEAGKERLEEKRKQLEWEKKFKGGKK